MIGSLTGWWGMVIDAPDAEALARFYSALLGWDVAKSDETWATLEPQGKSYIAFQTSVGYVPPVWPPRDGRQQMMAHIDIGVRDLEGAVEEAIELGAKPADHQPQDDVRVMLDPAGHPFCLYRDTD